MNCSHWTLYLTPLALLTGLYAATNNLWVIAFFEWAVFASSVYYWSHYVCGWRRTVDMAIVQLSLLAHLYFAVRYKSWTTLKLYALAMILYAVGVYYNSFAAHTLLWIFACVANIILIRSIKDHTRSSY